MYFDIAYAPFGETYATTGSTDPAYTGQRQDTAGGLYDFPLREYSTQGRWPSPDPAGLKSVHLSRPQSLNRYAYAGNSPLSVTDPSGLDPCGGGGDGGGGGGSDGGGGGGNGDGSGDGGGGGDGGSCDPEVDACSDIAIYFGGVAGRGMIAPGFSLGHHSVGRNHRHFRRHYPLAGDACGGGDPNTGDPTVGSDPNGGNQNTSSGNCLPGEICDSNGNAVNISLTFCNDTTCQNITQIVVDGNADVPLNPSAAQVFGQLDNTFPGFLTYRAAFSPNTCAWVTVATAGAGTLALFGPPGADLVGGAGTVVGLVAIVGGCL